MSNAGVFGETKINWTKTAHRTRERLGGLSALCRYVHSVVWSWV